MADFRPATVPYDPTPDALPTTQAPDDYLRVRATPNDFGAQIGQAVEGFGRQLGQSASDLFEVSQKKAAIQNEAVVNGALTQTMQANSDLLYKPPQLDPKGNPIPGTGGYFSQNGSAAVGGYQATVDALNQNYERIRSQLTPRQQVMFDQLQRRNHQYLLESVGRHADSQGQQWQDQQTGSFITTTSQQASLAAVSGHMDQFDHLIDQGIGAAKHWAQLKGYGDEWGDQKSQVFVGETVANAAKQMIDGGRPQDAASLLQKYESQMDKGNVLAVKAALKGNARAIDAQREADKYLGQIGYGASTTNQQDVVDRIIQVESGGNPDAQAATSSAKGLGQFTKDTWDQFLAAEHPELLGKGDLRSNPELSREATAWYAQRNAGALRNAGYAPSAGNVYLAHFLGPQGAIDMLSAPPNANAADVNPEAAAANRTIFYAKDGTPRSAAEVVDWAARKMGDASGLPESRNIPSGAGITGVVPSGPLSAAHGQRAQILADKAGIINDIRQRYANDPQMADAIIARVNQGIATATLQQQAAQQRALADQDQALDEYLKPAMKGQDVAPLIQKMADDPRLSAEKRDWLFNALQSMGQGKAYGTDFYTYFQKVHEDGNDRITDPGQLLQAVDGQHLTLEGFDKLRSEIQGGKNIESAAEADMRKSALAYIKQKLTFADDTLMIKDPAGESIFNGNAIPAFYQAYEAGLKAGKTPYQLLSKDSPDFIGDKIVSTFKRSDAQEMKDRIAAGEDAVTTKAEPPPPSQFDLNTPEGVVAAFHAGSISRADAGSRLDAMRQKMQNPVPNQ